MPAETEDMIKELPVPLGAPAYKRVWPDAVWPSDIPGTTPLSLAIDFADLSRRTTDEEEGVSETVKNDFRFPQEVGFLAGGTLGETLSFLTEVAFEPEVEEGQSEVGIDIEHGQINFNGPFGWGAAFNLKVGRFAPEVTQGFSHGAVLTSEGPAAMLQFVPIAAHGGSEIGGHEGGAGIALPHSVDGLEAYGIVGHRFLYAGGLANGIGPGEETVDGNSAKDVYGKIAYKFGGLALDGDGYIPSENNWRELSLRVSAFGYRGDGGDVLFAGHEDGSLVEDTTFTRAGFDVNLYVQDLNVLAGFVRGRDTLVEHGPEVDTGDFVYRAWFTEGDYVIMPWLHGALRYEWLRPAREGAPDFKRIVPHLTALVRANVKASVEYQRDLGESDNYLLAGALAFAF